MLRWALIFLVIALIAGALGFGGVAGVATDIAAIIFYTFVGLMLLFLILGLVAGAKIAS